MNDYLSSLVAKNLSPQASIHPRPSARFEPAGNQSVGAAPLAGVQEEVTTLSVLPPADPAFVHQPGEGPPPGPATVHPAGQFLQSASPAQEPPAIAPYLGQLDAPGNLLTASDQHPEWEAEPAAPLSRPAVQPDISRPLSDESPATRDGPLDHILERVVLLSGEPAVAPPGPASLGPDSLPPTSAPALPRLSPLVPPLPDLAASRAAPAPTVNVTIGRIEVRAAPPPTAARRQSSQPKHMSLDEYLRSRKDGNGR
jgi:hypothetical protein